MHKVAIVTWTKWNNYGTILQSYALSSTISAMGFDVYVLDDTLISSTYCVQRWGEPKSNCSFWKKWKKHFKLQKLKGWNRYIQTREKYCLEQKNKIIHYWKKDVSYPKLHKLSLSFDYFVCGSDQIWTPDDIFFDPYYFLTFVRNKIKIAYAPSIGRNSYPEDKKNIVRDALKDFSHISVREQTGKCIISDITKYTDISIVLDPTLLLTAEQWEKCLDLKRNSQQSRYALFYFLGEQQWYRQDSIEFCKQRNIKVVNIPNIESDYKVKDSPNIGAIEFLELIKNADYVFTDSFHGFIFSLIFSKDVYVFQRFKETDEKSQNSRIKDLCELLQIKNRYYESPQLLHKQISPINYKSVHQKIDTERKKSLNYLREAFCLNIQNGSE